MLTVGMYKTRDGRDVKIVAVEDRIAIGYSVKEGINSLTTWNANNGCRFRWRGVLNERTGTGEHAGSVHRHRSCAYRLREGREPYVTRR